ncbi:hypothetical protein F4821DRAFT_224946 [Hypoxylon rubiginosum]|uniref:Uncharacterized protein n=1 Tax=Hypoxylon rubiginosum TaxID=110542 RepID=A0ACC0DHA0_9PEZI|nr:hypothetical protein F4821DRAFT_224946 [Hypoxylon rubiginosum]
MSTPYICHRCIARLARFRVKPQKHRIQLHTQTAAALTSGSQPLWAPDKEQRQGLAFEDDVLAGDGTDTSRSHPVTNTQRLRNGAFAKVYPRWDGQLKKFIPRRRPLAIDGLPVEGSRDLKRKILGAFGNYNVIYDDLKDFYGLTHEETRQTIAQLGRLLWGWHSLEEAAMRLDLYHDWKSNFKDLSRTTEGSVDSEASSDERIMKTTWQRLDQQKRESLWPQTILSILRTNPGTLPSFIQSTFQSSWCSSYILEDSLYILFRAFDGKEIGPTKQQQLLELVMFLLENSSPRYISLEQMIIQKLVSWLPTAQVLELYEALKAVEHPLHWNTLLHFASRFAQNSIYKVEATQVLQSLQSRRGFDINSPAAASVCTTLLNLKAEDRLPDDEAAPDELFKMLLDIGFHPNLLGLSALMRNFCVRGRVEVAWNIFNLLIQRRIQPDVHVFSILLNGAKNALDIESLQRVVNVIGASKSWSPYLVNDLLGFIYQSNEFHNKSGKLSRIHRKKNCVMTWQLMVQVYTKFYNLAPLQKLILYPLENLLVPDAKKQLPAHLSQVNRLTAALAPLPDRLLMRPDSTTLGLMFEAHLRSIKNPKPLKVYYHHFVQLLRKGDRTIVNLVKDQGNMIYNIFLRDFLQFNTTVKDGLRIVREATLEHRQPGKTPHHPPPSVHTYTILMNGLKNCRHPRGVITTLNTMIKEGIAPNITTWNVVIGTLLKENYVWQAVKVMQHLEQVGLQANDRTVQEISSLSYSKRRWVAKLVEKLGEKRFDFKDQRALAESLLRIWKGKPSQISMKQACTINRQHGEVRESAGEPLLEAASSE